MLLLLLLLAITSCSAIRTDYIEFNAIGSVLRVGDAAQSMWLGVNAEVTEPVVTRSTDAEVSMHLGNVSCVAARDVNLATCLLPASGQLVGSSQLHRNSTQVYITSDKYDISIVANLYGAQWSTGFAWEGKGELVIRVVEQTPKQRQQRVEVGIYCFIAASGITFIAHMLLSWPYLHAPALMSGGA